MGLTASYTEAVLVTPVIGQPGDIHSTAQNALGTESKDQFGNDYIYLGGVVSTVEGMAATFDEAGVVTLLAANAKGPVAWATGAIVAAKFGWWARKGNLLGRVAANTADNALLGRETTDGEIGDGRAAGDQIYGVMSRAATGAAAALSSIQVYTDAFVDDVYGS